MFNVASRQTFLAWIEENHNPPLRVIDPSAKKEEKPDKDHCHLGAPCYVFVLQCHQIVSSVRTPLLIAPLSVGGSGTYCALFIETAKKAPSSLKRFTRATCSVVKARTVEDPARHPSTSTKQTKATKRQRQYQERQAAPNVRSLPLVTY